jgi:hypothetical protein
VSANIPKPGKVQNLKNFAVNIFQKKLIYLNNLLCGGGLGIISDLQRTKTKSIGIQEGREPLGQP